MIYSKMYISTYYGCVIKENVLNILYKNYSAWYLKDNVNILKIA